MKDIIVLITQEREIVRRWGLTIEEREENSNKTNVKDSEE
jgi:hypothetical protein